MKSDPGHFSPPLTLERHFSSRFVQPFEQDTFSAYDLKATHLITTLDDFDALSYLTRKSHSI